MLSGCLDAELNDVPLSDCPENWGQTWKLLFFHRFLNDGSKNIFEPNLAVDPTDPTLLATWTPLLAASDETKPVQSPYLSEPVSEAGAKRTYGGGNATRGGITYNIGREPQPFEGKFISVKQDAIKALKTFQVGAGGHRSAIGVVLINEAGQMAFDSNGEASDSEDLDLFPFEIHSLFFGDKTLGGLEAVDNNMVSFEFLPNWSDNFTIVTPSDFDALEDLVNS